MLEMRAARDGLYEFYAAHAAKLAQGQVSLSFTAPKST
ncbi:hypothetical protein FHS42_003308 [Streptomyces zagrosensis]|uniref:Uncharacterized protein n=1 Tax=Streptomyces zagrosensis TaxID=1042984 RepID=A0A7W9Q9Q5_9ACTN|nr:hypothetical protein [Streptomyces zagrosensis]